MTAAAGRVDDARGAFLRTGHHRNDKPVVADSDKFLLQDAVVPVLLKESLKRLVDLAALALHIAAHAGQQRAGVIGDRAIGQDLAGDGFDGFAEIGDCVGPPCEQWEC